MRLSFPESGEDMADAFNNAIAEGVMQRDDQQDPMTFWPRFEFLGSDVEGDEVVADWFHHAHSNIFVRVLRKESST